MSPPSSLYEAVVSQVSEFEVPSLDGYAKEAEKILSANVEVSGMWCILMTTNDNLTCRRLVAL